MWLDIHEQGGRDTRLAINPLRQTLAASSN